MQGDCMIPEVIGMIRTIDALLVTVRCRSATHWTDAFAALLITVVIVITNNPAQTVLFSDRHHSQRPSHRKHRFGRLLVNPVKLETIIIPPHYHRLVNFCKKLLVTLLQLKTSTEILAVTTVLTTMHRIRQLVEKTWIRFSFGIRCWSS